MEATSAKSIHTLPQRLLRQYNYRQANTLGIFIMQKGGVVVSNSPSKKTKIRLTGDSKLQNFTVSLPFHFMEKVF